MKSRTKSQNTVTPTLLGSNGSDHLLQQYDVAITYPSNTQKVSGAQKTIKIATWNVLDQCKKTVFKKEKTDQVKYGSNNPWDYKETYDAFQDRQELIANKILESGASIICLQECDEEMGKTIVGILNKFNNRGKKFKFAHSESHDYGGKHIPGRKSLVTIYDANSVHFAKKEDSFIYEKLHKEGGLITTKVCGLSTTFNFKDTDSSFLVQNVHADYHDRNPPKGSSITENLTKLQNLNNVNFPIFSLGDHNKHFKDLSSGQKKNNTKTICSIGSRAATNFDAKKTAQYKDLPQARAAFGLGRGEADIADKCYDYLNVITPDNIEVKIETTELGFTQGTGSEIFVNQLSPQHIKIHNGNITGNNLSRNPVITNRPKTNTSAPKGKHDNYPDNTNIAANNAALSKYNQVLKKVKNDLKNSQVAFMPEGASRCGFFNKRTFEEKHFSNQDDVVVLFGGNQNHVKNPLNGNNGDGQAEHAKKATSPDHQGTFAFPITTGHSSDPWWDNINHGKRIINAEIAVLKKFLEAGGKIVIPTHNDETPSMAGGLCSNNLKEVNNGAVVTWLKNEVKNLKDFANDINPKKPDQDGEEALRELKEFVALRALYLAKKQNDIGSFCDLVLRNSPDNASLEALNESIQAKVSARILDAKNSSHENEKLQRPSIIKNYEDEEKDDLYTNAFNNDPDPYNTTILKQDEVFDYGTEPDNYGVDPGACFEEYPQYHHYQAKKATATDDTLTFYHPTYTKDSGVRNDSNKFDFSLSEQGEKNFSEGKVITNALRAAQSKVFGNYDGLSAEGKESADEFSALYLAIAIEVGGVGRRPEKFKNKLFNFWSNYDNTLNSLLSDLKVIQEKRTYCEDPNELQNLNLVLKEESTICDQIDKFITPYFQQAQDFSKAFQDATKDLGIFTGNQNCDHPENVGMRLKRVTPNFIFSAFEINDASKDALRSEFPNLMQETRQPSVENHNEIPSSTPTNKTGSNPQPLSQKETLQNNQGGAPSNRRHSR